MKEIIKKISNFCSMIFGYGIYASLIIGGLTFVGYVIALIVGGEIATSICDFIYKSIYPVLVTATSIIVFLGLIVMYMRGESALSTNNKKSKKDIKGEK